MKFSTIISTAAFTASTLAIATPFDKVRMIKRQQPFLNGSIALGNEDSTVYRTVTPTSTITHLKTIVVSIPTTTTSAREVVSQSVVVSEVVTTKDNGEITTVDVTSTEKLTSTVYDTITTQTVKTITAPAQDAQNVINSAVNNDGVASVDNIIVSKKKKTLTVTHPIYITVTASATASGISPAIVTSLAGNDVDTVTLETDVTSTLKATTTAPYQNGTLSTGDYAANQLITTTVVLPKSETTVHTYTHQVTSTVTNFIVVTHTAALPSESASVETVTSVNEFIYNSQEVATETSTSMVTSVITLTRTATQQTTTETQKNTIYYTVTRTLASTTVVETRSAVDTETKTRTNTFTITVPVSATCTAAAVSGVEATSTVDSAAAALASTFSTTLYARPSLASMSSAWNATSASVTESAAGSFQRRHVNKRRFALWF
jgi:hypothetical protein